MPVTTPSRLQQRSQRLLCLRKPSSGSGTTEIGNNYQVPLASHINELPDEVLRNIFFLVDDNQRLLRTLPLRPYGWLQDTSQRNALHPDPLSDPCMVLSHVCQRWRAVVVTDPSFWSSLEIDVPAVYHDLTDRLEYKMVRKTESLLRMCLSRASPTATRLSLSRIPTTFRSLLPVIRLHLYKISCLSLDLDGMGECADAILNAISLHSALAGTAHGDTRRLCLEELIIRSASRPTFDILERHPEFIHPEAPHWRAIQTLRILGHDCPLPSSLKIQSINMPQLTDIDIDSALSLDELLSLLGRCPNLVSVELKTLKPSSRSSTPTPGPLIMDKLHHLDLKTSVRLKTSLNEDAEATLLYNAVKYLTLPALTTMRLWTFVDSPPGTPPSLMSTNSAITTTNVRNIREFLRRSQCRIEQLDISDNGPAGTSTVRGILELEELSSILGLGVTVGHYRSATDFLQLLTPERDSTRRRPTVLPRLQQLDARVASDNDFLNHLYQHQRDDNDHTMSRPERRQAFLKALHILIQTRADLGHDTERLYRVALFGPYITPEEREWFKQVEQQCDTMMSFLY